MDSEEDMHDARGEEYDYEYEEDDDDFYSGEGGAGSDDGDFVEYEFDNESDDADDIASRRMQVNASALGVAAFLLLSWLELDWCGGCS